MTYEEQLEQFNSYLNSEFESLKTEYQDSLVLPFEDEIKSIALKMQESGLRKFAPSFIVGAVAQTLHRVAFNESLTEDVKSEGEWVTHNVENVISLQAFNYISKGFRRFTNPKYYNSAILLWDINKLVEAPVLYSKELPKVILSRLPISKNWGKMPRMEKPFIIHVHKEYNLDSITDVPSIAVTHNNLGHPFVYVANDPKSFEPVWDYFEKPEWMK